MGLGAQGPALQAWVGSQAGSPRSEFGPPQRTGRLPLPLKRPPGVDPATGLARGPSLDGPTGAGSGPQGVANRLDVLGPPGDWPVPFLAVGHGLGCFVLDCGVSFYVYTRLGVQVCSCSCAWRTQGRSPTGA